MLKHLCGCLSLEGEHAPETLSITKSNAAMLLLPSEGNLSFNFIEVFSCLTKPVLTI